MTNTTLLIGLALGTLVSEDLTSITAGLLARDETIGLIPATVACVAGVYLGDMGLWLLGRSVRTALGTRFARSRWASWITSWMDAESLSTLGARIDRNLAVAVLGCRFLPGSRLPMYVAVGLCGERPLAFAGWSFVAVVLWTPSLIWLTSTFGASLTRSLVTELSGAWHLVVSATILLALWTLMTKAVSLSLSSRS